MPVLSADVDVELDVVDRNNKPPVWDANVYGPIHIKENVTVGTVVTSVKARFVCHDMTETRHVTCRAVPCSAVPPISLSLSLFSLWSVDHPLTYFVYFTFCSFPIQLLVFYLSFCPIDSIYALGFTFRHTLDSLFFYLFPILSQHSIFILFIFSYLLLFLDSFRHTLYRILSCFLIFWLWKHLWLSAAR